MIDNTKLGRVLAFKFPVEYDQTAYMVLQDEDDVQSIHVWDDEKMGRGTPSEEELTTWETEYNAQEYKVLRKDRYPALQDLADAIYWGEKGDDSLMTAYVAACEKVKEDFPKHG
jgi:hypothetical protein|tara:strand:+ start:456 stop:797 length:342 start_codon:yes stop_codon:yes gene_type:complete